MKRHTLGTLKYFSARSMASAALRKESSFQSSQSGHKPSHTKSGTHMIWEYFWMQMGKQLVFDGIKRIPEANEQRKGHTRYLGDSQVILGEVHGSGRVFQFIYRVPLNPLGTQTL